MTACSILTIFVLRFFLARSNAQMDREEGETSVGSVEDVEKSTVAPFVKKPRYIL